MSAALSPFVESSLAHDLPPAEPTWLQQARLAQRDAFAADGLPTTRMEGWRYTAALRALAQRRFGIDAQAATRALTPDLLGLPAPRGPRLVFLHGVFRADLSALDDLPPGLRVSTLAQDLARGDDESWRATFGQAHAGAGDAFWRLNAASALDGLHLRVDAGALIAPPVELVFAGMPAEGDVAWHARQCIVLGEGATLILVERHLAAGTNAHLGTLLSDVALHARARLHLLTVQDAAATATLLRRTQLRVEAQAQAQLHALELGGALARHELQVELLGAAAEVRSAGAFVPNGRQHIETALAIAHRARDTVSQSHWRGIADGRARGVFRGAILVAAGADGSAAALSNKNLLLSADAEIDTRPELEIHADEVKAAHGATVGQLDERALFYLRSRGIPLAQARALLTAAFCQGVFDDIADAALREALRAPLAARLP